MISQGSRWVWAMALALGAQAPPGRCDPVAPSPVSTIDLAATFQTSSPWRLVVKRGPSVDDYGGDPAPGALDICLQRGSAGRCEQEAVAALKPGHGADSTEWGPHYLRLAKPVYPSGGASAPLFQLVTASLHAGDGGQVVVTQLLKYDRSRDAFERIYFHSTGTNNNEEVRVIADGPLRGDVIAAEPTGDAPYGYWMTVNRLTPSRTYRRALRYRSVTRYNDGNALAVIDSEFPNIERRLGLWKPGSPIPTPPNLATPCLQPRLKRMELWCEASRKPQPIPTSTGGSSAAYTPRPSSRGSGPT